MQALLLVGPTPVNGSYGFFSAFSGNALISHRGRSCPYYRRDDNRSSRHRWVPLAASSSSFPSSDAINGKQNHYSVLGIERDAAPADIKRAYRLLARKYHPDVSKDSRASEIFKNIHRAYEVLSNNVTRIQYDRELTLQEDTVRSYKGKWNDSSEFEDRVRIYRWAELRRKMHKRYKEQNNVNEKNSFFYNETDEQGNLDQDRGSFTVVLSFAFVSLFLLQTFGSLLSLTFSTLMAFFDRKLDAGYKMGYLIAWIMGGRGGILLTLCLYFATWAFGKTSSSLVALVVVAMWVASSLARYAPLPQGAVLTLLYMSMKLQTDFN
ncbi:hypothetical protein SLE2022_127570 [Rubroshorea leprosula]